VPGELVEEVDSVDEDRGLVLPNVGGTEGLAHTVGGGDGVGIHHGDLETIGKAPRNEGVMEVGKPEEDGAAIAPATNQEDTKAAPGGTGIWHVVSNLHELLLIAGYNQFRHPLQRYAATRYNTIPPVNQVPGEGPSTARK
jgi:hypothetical protein